MYEVHMDYTPWQDDDPTLELIGKTLTFADAEVMIHISQKQSQFHAATWYTIGTEDNPVENFIRNDSLPLPNPASILAEAKATVFPDLIV